LLIIGTKLCKARFSRRFILISGILFSFCTPLGAIFGFALSSSEYSNSQVVNCILLSLAAGTFLFMALNELKDELNAFRPFLFFKSCAFLLGFFLMALLKIWV